MVDSDKVSAAAAQAAELASQLKDKVTKAADEFVTRAGPVAEQASARVVELAAKAGKAAAPHVDTVAAGLKTATSGKGTDKIDSFSASLKKVLDPDHENG